MWYPPKFALATERRGLIWIKSVSQPDPHGFNQLDFPPRRSSIPECAWRRMVDHGRMNPLSLFGLFAVAAMLLCYALEDRSRWFVLGFAVSCMLGSAYGFLQGAW